MSYSNLFAVILASLCWAFVVAAEPRPEKPIVFGQTAALTGPLARIGTEMRTGILAAFSEAEQTGDVQVGGVRLVTRDDRYEINRAIRATHDLIRKDRVFAFLGSVGTSTAKAVQPLTEELGIPFVAPVSGAEFLQDPRLTNVINVRRSYASEITMLVDRLVGDLGTRRVAVLYQDDAFGLTGLGSVRSALRKKNLNLVSEGRFRRSTTAVKRALLDIARGKPEAVILIAPYQAAASFIKLAEEIQFNPTFMTVSSVGTIALAEELNGYTGNVFVTQVVPHPADITKPLVSRYRRALRAIAPDVEPSFTSLEGYIAGRLVLTALSQAQRPLTRKSFLEAFYKVDTFDIDGFALNYRKHKKQGATDVFLTQISRSGEIVAVNSLVTRVN